MSLTPHQTTIPLYNQKLESSNGMEHVSQSVLKHHSSHISHSFLDSFSAYLCKITTGMLGLPGLSNSDNQIRPLHSTSSHCRCCSSHLTAGAAVVIVTSLQVLYNMYLHDQFLSHNPITYRNFKF